MKTTKYIKTLVCFFLLITLILPQPGLAEDNHPQEPVDYVNPLIGNISHLLVPTYPTVHLPNSMLRVYPERSDYTVDQIKGLPVVVTSHRGSSAFNISVNQGGIEELQPIKKFSYDQEKISPYRYSVYLDEEKIAVDYAPSHHSGLYELSFEKNGNKSLIINVGNGNLSFDGEGISGYQSLGRSATKVYLYLETKQTPLKSGALIDGKYISGQRSVDGQNQALVLDYSKENTIVNIRYGVSFISTAQAKRNLRAEIKDYQVSTLAMAGRDIWNKALGKILIEGASATEKTIFYTSLYRTYERMINISEDGCYYSAFDGKIHKDGGRNFYTDDWVWDTYRAVHPLRTLIDANMEEDMIQSYVLMAQQSPRGWMPTFPEVTGDSHRMNANHAVAVIWDAYSKGLRNFDYKAAYEACKGALTEKSLLPWTKVASNELDVFYNQKGYFPALRPEEKEYCADVNLSEKRQPVAVTLGTSFDDWCMAQLAKTLKEEADYKYFIKRSANYKNLYNAGTGFFHPKDSAGRFIQPFDYRYSGGMGARDYYDENNGWVYRWDVQHDIAGLIHLMGGSDIFARNLDNTFREPLGKSKYSFFATLPDHTGNVGQFSMANEPSLHIPYLYNYAGQAWKTQKRIRQLLKSWFRNDLMGVPGDEDGGGLSAFVVFSSMGFYPVTPGSGSYAIGSPLFSRVSIDVGRGNSFEIIAKDASEDNKYIQSATLNGKAWNKATIEHSDIVAGGKLELVMGNKANTSWGAIH